MAEEAVTTATAEAPAVPMHREERHSVDYAAQRIAQGLIGATEPTETPSDEPDAPSHEAADEVSAEPIETHEVEEALATSDEVVTAEDAPDAPPELPSTIAELAQAFEAEPERFNDLKLTAKVDGEEVEVTLAEAVAGYQRSSDYTQKTQALSQERAEFQQAVTAAEAELQSRVANLATLTKTLQSQITGKEPDWNKLLNENPTAYVKTKHEWDQKQAALRASLAQVGQQQQQMQQQQLQQVQQHLEAERQRMVTTYPELADPEGTVAKEMRAYLKSKGFTDQDIGNLADSRMIDVLVDAVKAQSVSSAAPEKKLVKPKSRTVRPGSPGRGEDQQDRLTVARRNHRANPKSDDAAAARIALLMQRSR
jgi:hypothetical protein